MKFWKGQELAKTERKARSQREQIFLLQDAQGQLGSEERKAKHGEQGSVLGPFGTFAEIHSTYPGALMHYSRLGFQKAHISKYKIRLEVKETSGYAVRVTG